MSLIYLTQIENCFYFLDVLDYLLERPDPAVQHVEDLLNVYETPYKVVPSAGMSFAQHKKHYMYLVFSIYVVTFWTVSVRELFATVYVQP